MDSVAMNAIGRESLVAIQDSPHAVGLSRWPKDDAFGQALPVSSTSSPTDSWHVDCEMAK
jgi:hypothetical protein